MTARELMEIAAAAGLQFFLEGEGLRLGGIGAEDFAKRHREEIKRLKQEILAVLRGEPLPEAENAQEEPNSRLEFALAFAARMEQEVDAGAPEWLEWAFWCLFADAMEGFVRWGLGEVWPQVQAAAEDPHQASEMRHRALEGWASWHRERERHRYSRQWSEIDQAWEARRDELALETETWAWRAYLLELARHNPEITNEEALDPWVDLRPWALWLARNGKRLGLVWSDREAA